MEHNLEEILQFLSENDIEFTTFPNTQKIVTHHSLGDYDVKIRAKLPKDFPYSPPNFHLVDRLNYGQLAHVSWGDNGYADICYGEKSSFSVDYHCAGAVFLGALKCALNILDSSLNDALYNNIEIFREFVAIWRVHAKESRNIICLAEVSDRVSELTIRSEIKKGRTVLSQKIYAINHSSNQCNPNHFLVQNSKNNKRINKGKGNYRQNSSQEILNQVLMMALWPLILARKVPLLYTKKIP